MNNCRQWCFLNKNYSNSPQSDLFLFVVSGKYEVEGSSQDMKSVVFRKEWIYTDKKIILLYRFKSFIISPLCLKDVRSECLVLLPIFEH